MVVIQKTSVTKEVQLSSSRRINSPATEIAARLKKADNDKVQWDPEHAAAIERFWDYLQNEAGQPLPSSPEPGKGEAGAEDVIRDTDG